jgi:hypothetical protein
MADAYRKIHPNGSATVTQFQPRPQLLVRTERTHRPTIYSYADAVFSPKLPPPTPESLRYDLFYTGHIHVYISVLTVLTPKVVVSMTLLAS